MRIRSIPRFLTRPALCVVFAGLLLAASAPAGHAQLAGFHTPSLNIGCLLAGGSLRCDIQSKSWNGPSRPTTCGLDYGDSLFMSGRGAPRWTCHGDTVLRQGRALPYGAVWHAGSFTCSSWQEGLTCTNRTGHGFFLSKQAYRVF